MKKRIAFIILLISFSAYGQTQTSEIAGQAASYSRIGFGPRGISMGNSMSAVRNGTLVSYYNPATNVYQDGNQFMASYSFLSLDRSLNFLSFTKKFQFGKNKDGSYRSTAGISAGIINSGVSNIDGRDNQGISTGTLSTSENQYFVSFANKFSNKLSIGLSIKFNHYNLYEEVTATSLSFDFGALYIVNENMTISAVIHDINGKYKWDSTPIYGQSGSNFSEKFPKQFVLGTAYNFNKINLLATTEFVYSPSGLSLLRFGAEYEIYPQLYLRGGVDNWNLANSEFPVSPSAGFSYFYTLDKWLVGIEYAYALEAFSNSARHVIGLNINF